MQELIEKASLRHLGKSIEEIVYARMDSQAYERELIPQFKTIVEKPQISTVISKLIKNNPKDGSEAHQAGCPASAKTGFSRRPTLIKKKTNKDSARIDVASAHSALTQATLKADFHKQVQLHAQAKVNFTKIPKSIERLAK